MKKRWKGLQCIIFPVWVSASSLTLLAQQEGYSARRKSVPLIPNVLFQYKWTKKTEAQLLHYCVYNDTTTTLPCLLLHYYYTTVSTTTQLLHYRVYYYLSFCLTVKWMWLMQQIFTGLMNSFSALPSVLWCCWLSGRKGIRPVKNSVMRYWRGHLSGARCKWFAYGTADATATPSPLAPVKSRMVYLSGAGIPRLYWEKGR